MHDNVLCFQCWTSMKLTVYRVLILALVLAVLNFPVLPRGIMLVKDRVQTYPMA